MHQTQPLAWPQNESRLLSWRRCAAAQAGGATAQHVLRGAYGHWQFVHFCTQIRGVTAEVSTALDVERRAVFSDVYSKSHILPSHFRLIKDMEINPQVRTTVHLLIFRAGIVIVYFRVGLPANVLHPGGIAF